MLAFFAAIFVLLFTYTGFSKLLRHDAFEVVLRSSPFLNHWSGFLLWFIPSLELVTAILLLFQSTRFVGFYFSFSLMIIFSVYIAVMLSSSSNLPCSCGGVLDQLSWKGHLILNLILAILAGASAFLEVKRISSYKQQKI